MLHEGLFSQLKVPTQTLFKTIWKSSFPDFDMLGCIRIIKCNCGPAQTSPTTFCREYKVKCANGSTHITKNVLSWIQGQMRKWQPAITFNNADVEIVLWGGLGSDSQPPNQKLPGNRKRPDYYVHEKINGIDHDLFPKVCSQCHWFRHKPVCE